MQAVIRQALATLAAGVALGWVAVSAMTSLQAFSFVPPGLVWLSVAGLLCGILLGLVSNGGPWMIVVASLVGVIVFVLGWTYVYWDLLGRIFSYWEVLMSDMVFIYVFKRAILVLLAAVPTGLIGAVAMVTFLPGLARD